MKKRYVFFALCWVMSVVIFFDALGDPPAPKFHMTESDHFVSCIVTGIVLGIPSAAFIFAIGYSFIMTAKMIADRYRK